MSLTALTTLRLPDVPRTDNRGVHAFLMQLKRVFEIMAGNKSVGDRMLTVNDIEEILSMVTPMYSTPHGKYVERGSYYSRFLENSLGNINMGVDGSVTPWTYTVTVPEGQYYLVYRAILDIQDDGSWLPSGYGANGAMTNGLTGNVSDENGNVLFNVTTQKTIKQNSDWAAFCYDVNLLDWGNPASTKNMGARWTFKRDGAPLLLLPGWTFNMTVNDDLTGLSLHTIRLGILRGKYPLTEDLPASYPDLS